MGFFDRATKTVETMGKNVSKAAKDNMEIVKCSSAIESCDEKPLHDFLHDFLCNKLTNIVTKCKRCEELFKIYYKIHFRRLGYSTKMYLLQLWEGGCMTFDNAKPGIIKKPVD